MPTPKKIQTVEEIQSKLNEASCVVLTDFRGLNVAQATALRRRLTEAGVEYKVYKNTLIKIAADNVGIEGLDSYLQGPTALAFSTEDPIAPAKILADFARETKILKVKAGVLDGQIIDKDRVAELAALPPKEVILGKVVGGNAGTDFWPGQCACWSHAQTSMGVGCHKATKGRSRRRSSDRSGSIRGRKMCYD